MSPTPSQDWEKAEPGSHLAGHDLLQPRVGHHHRIFCLRLCKVNLIINKNAKIHPCLRFLVGFFVAGNILSIVVLMSEIVGASW